MAPNEREKFLEELELHFSSLYSFARWITNGNEEAEDLVHDTVSRAIANWTQFEQALVHESVRDAHGTFWRPNLLPDDRLGFRLAQLSHPVQNIAPDPCLPLLRFVPARAKAVSARALVPEEEFLDGAVSSMP